jgi:hypothetical protein
VPFRLHAPSAGTAAPFQFIFSKLNILNGLNTSACRGIVTVAFGDHERNSSTCRAFGV